MTDAFQICNAEKDLSMRITNILTKNSYFLSRGSVLEYEKDVKYGKEVKMTIILDKWLYS